MPIQQISERKSPPIIGKIRLGIKKQSQSGSEYPSNVDYFVLHDAKQVVDVYGNMPKELDIVFPSDELEKVMPTWLKWYGQGTKDRSGKVIGGKIKCRGNGPDSQGNPGVAMHYCQQNLKTGEIPTRPCAGDKCPDWLDSRGNRQCKPAMSVYVMLPKVSPFGVFRIDTTSWLSIKSFNDQLEWVRQLNGGRIALIPFKLVKEEREVRYFDHKKGQEERKAQWIMVLKPNENKAEIEGMRKNLELLSSASIAWQPPQDLLESPMEDNYPAVDAEHQDASEQKISLAEELVRDADVSAAFAEMENVRGAKLRDEERLVLIRKKEQLPNFGKQLILDTIAKAVADLKAKAKATKTEDVKKTPPVVQEAPPPQDDAGGII